MSTVGFPPGPYRLEITQLVDKNDTVLQTAYLTSFIVGALKGFVPSELRVEHAIYMAIGDLTSQRLGAGQDPPAGFKYVELVKVANRQTNESSKLAFDVQGNAISLPEKDITDLTQRQLKKYGRLSESLYEVMSGLKGTDTVTVHVWPFIEFDLHAYDKPTTGVISE